MCTSLNILNSMVSESITIYNISHHSIIIGETNSNVYISSTKYNPTDEDDNYIDEHMYLKILAINNTSGISSDIGGLSGIIINTGYIKTSEDATKFLFKLTSKG